MIFLLDNGQFFIDVSGFNPFFRFKNSDIARFTSSIYMVNTSQADLGFLGGKGEARDFQFSDAFGWTSLALPHDQRSK